jgi:predicted nucleotidyltransferase
MAPQIARHREQIAAFCRKWQVVEFYVFGSAVRKDFWPPSDIDVAVRFSPTATYSLFDLVDMQDE